VACEAVGQKFAALPNLAVLLLGTGHCVIAEMTRNDANWGTGIDIGHESEHHPARWRGTNILGWALMTTRDQMRVDAHQSTAALPVGSSNRQIVASGSAAQFVLAKGTACVGGSASEQATHEGLDAAAAAQAGAVSSRPSQDAQPATMGREEKDNEDDEDDEDEDEDESAVGVRDASANLEPSGSGSVRGATNKAERKGRKGRQGRRTARLQNDWLRPES